MIVKDDSSATEALAIVEKYEAFVTYLYPILQNSPRKHGVLRDAVLAALFTPIGGLYHAAKSRQISRLYAIDAEFATLRAFLRFLARGEIKILTPKQHVTALALLAQPGGMLNAWQKKLVAASLASKNSRTFGPRMGETGQ
ncbi:diversity-generating retroelement protein Avd [Bradyrhizobium sp. SEMIA]|uniref:diversity-generating retroelement protein Avd n=1 Tax=Bradyrhizobium sp. SEMIA TaxID=2597515 RepID=UPI0018A468AF|nr:diversity-generating retroelement protein Avd [Bradyrhizobium sp. SEMIA]QOG20424.1 diversity-generating retroelement protein Avd [Bradyrhizobium sp. SEMIA]